MVNWLLDQGANAQQPNARSFTPLLCAVDSGKWEVADLLLSIGAQIEQIDKYGRTPLMIAAYKGHIGVVEMLLARGWYFIVSQIGFSYYYRSTFDRGWYPIVHQIGY